MNLATAVLSLAVLFAATAASADGEFPYIISRGGIVHRAPQADGAAPAQQGEWPWQLGGIHVPPPADI